MKKYVLIIVLLVCSLASFSQVERILSGFEPSTMRPGFIYRDTTIPLPRTLLGYFTAYGTFGSFYDTARAAISLTTTGSGAATYNSTTGVFNIPTPGGASAAGSTTEIQYNDAGSFGASNTFRYSPTGITISTKTYGGLVVKPVIPATANTDTIIGLNINPSLNTGAFTGVIKQSIKIGNAFINVDSNYNFSFGDGSAGKPSGGRAVMFGQFSGTGVTGVENVNFFGYATGYQATGAGNSNFLGGGAGQSATNASYSNFLGTQAGKDATGANNSNFFGYTTGITATGANNSNFFGLATGASATNASYSNFMGAGAGGFATNANNSNFFGNTAGLYASGASYANFYGNGAGAYATNATYSNFIGDNAGRGATGASYSNFFGFNAGDSATFHITGTNNILLGTNITTPLAASANTLNIGGVLYGTNLHSTTTGNPKSTAQTTGQIGINVTTPAASAILDLTSTTMGFLPPRMTATQGSAISSPADGLMIYVTDTNGTFTAIGFWGRENNVWVKL